MTKTVAELAVEVLERLEVIGSAETPTTVDSDTVQNYYASTFAEMQALGEIYWDQTDIPDEAFAALSDLIAGRIAPKFLLKAPDLEASGQARLWRLGSQGPTGLTVTGSYF